MTGKQLKNSILQMAIQGKLVPQDPNDEPASVLLEKIRQEKQRLIKEGKIRKDKNESVIFRGSDNLPYAKPGHFYEKTAYGKVRDITDELPFEIPGSWEWSRINFHTVLINGRAFKPSDWSYKGLPIVRIQNLNDPQAPYNYYSDEVNDKYVLNGGELLFAWSGTPGTSFGAHIWQSKKAILNQHIFKLDFNEQLLNKEYYKIAINERVNELITIAHGGVGLRHVTKPIVENTFIPIPPYNEQLRIVLKLENIDKYLISYNILEENLEQYNKSFTTLLNKSILQSAVQGKLVPQNSDDEPAINLITKIRIEKDQLVKSGKISKPKFDSHIFRRDNSYYEKLNGVERCIDDEIPFAIPENWEWVRLDSIVYNHGQLKPTTKFCYIDIGSIDNINHKLNDTNIIIEASDAPSRARKILKDNDIIYSTVRPYLHNVCIIDRSFPFMAIASTGFAVLSCYTGIECNYLFYLLLSPFFDKYVNDSENSKGVAYPAISEIKLKRALIPVPPTQEQSRIAMRIQYLINNIKSLA